ncbi:unnamed protein product [Leuciscus chuanchicus]
MDPQTLRQKHFLHYKFTVLTRSDSFPEFSAVCVYDERRIKHFSNEERVWILTDKDWTEAPEDPPDSRDWFIHQIRTLSTCTDSQCSDHVLQRIIGCELEKLPDGSVNLTVFDEYGFDGEDLISFNSETMQWIEKNPKAKETKEKWDRNTGRNQFLQYFLKTCTDWISAFHNTKQSSPDVHVSVSKSPDDESKLVLSCLATGFYPRDVQMNIRLNRINLEDQTSSGIRPNDDETFQMRISVKIDRNHEGSYGCLVTHSSLTEPVTVDWGGGIGYEMMKLRRSLTGTKMTYKSANRDAQQENHFLHYKFTVLTRSDSFPEFSAVCVYDDRRIKHFSNEERVWILTDKDWTEAPEDPPDSRDWFIHQIRTLSNCTDSQCSDHVLQRIIGCELEKLPDGSVNLTVFDEYGFDGEDLISFNYESMQWIDKNPKAKETKEKWDRQTGRNQFIKHFLKTCTDWISAFHNTNKSKF